MSTWAKDRVQRHLSECESCRARVDAASSHAAPQRTQSHTPLNEADSITSDGSQSHDDVSVGMLPSIEGYEVLSRIHSGAQGVVFKAVQKSTTRTVAVKLLPHEHAATDRQKHRFEREVSLAASLRHPNIVTVYDSGLTSGRYFFAMEYVHGKALNEHLSSTTLSVPDKLKMFATICSALSYAHQKGVIHRDLKPGNILVDAAGEPHVVDFGLAKSAGVIAMHGDTPFTLTSQFMGTLAYASPEQTKGDPALIDMRSDIYSLGVILFEMLTGTYPYPANTDLVKMFQTICNTPPRAPSSLAKDVDHDVDTIVLRTLAKEPERRYQSVKELQQDVERWLTGEPISARRDSLPYLVRLKSRRFIQRRRWSSAMAIILIAAIVGIRISNWFFTAWPMPINAFEHFATQSLAPSTSPGAMESVRLIVIDDSTPGHVEALAKAAGFADVSAENWKSIRRLHGRLMERLAQSGVRAVVWDITFTDEQPFNEDFIKGVRALQAVNVNPILGVGHWDIDENNPPEIAPDILATGVGWGGVTLGTDALAPWRADLVVQRGESTRLIGLALAGLGAMRHPMKTPSVHLDIDDETVQLRYVPTSSGRTVTMQSLAVAATDTVNLSSVRACVTPTADDTDAGIRGGDLVAQHVFLLPTDETLRQSTVVYQDVFTAADDQLREWFRGKLVVIGDTRRPPSSMDWYPTPDGRTLAGPQGHAAAIDSLLCSCVTIRYPGFVGNASIMLVGAILGLVVSALPWRGFLKRTVLLVFVFVFLTAGCVASYRLFGYLHNPFSPALALLLALAGGMLIHPLHPFGTEADPHRRSAT